ncbi:MHYT domain-containing protein [Streptomyces sp. NPDC087851]|uniref:MHYT domain-containing protein n=1 Tax=Streptomyces sp. NPDC087851 TaxID=3365810 RepID=UPI0037FE7427
MQGTVDGFNYGIVTPVAAYLMAVLGGALGLRCTTRSLRTDQGWKPGWLALGATSIGSGIWTMHFIAMIGFQVEEAPVSYDVPTTVLSLFVAIVMVGVGVFIVGYRGATRATLTTAGTITGLGVAAMHYIGMSGMRLHGRLEYDTTTVVLSVVIAVVAATAALWAAVSIHGFLPSLGASLVMGVAVTGMHYTGMAAISVHLQSATGGSAGGGSPTSIMFPLLLGPAVFLVLAGVVVMFDPLLVLGEGEWDRPIGKKPVRNGAAPRPVPPPPAYGDVNGGRVQAPTPPPAPTRPPQAPTSAPGSHRGAGPRGPYDW